jgi:cytochrome b
MSEAVDSGEMNAGAASPAPRVKVWDPIVRIGHWVIVIGVLTAYFTGDEVPMVHLWAGYSVGAALIIRVIWGFVGSRHARFSSFVTGPGAVWRYVTGLFNGQAKRSIGHNPAGAAMTLALLLALTGVTLSGVALQAVEDGTGPLAGVMASASQTQASEPSATSIEAQPRAYGEEREEAEDHGELAEGGGEGAEELYETLHSVFVYLLLALAAVHVVGVLVSSFAHKENLPRAMVTGRKRS